MRASPALFSSWREAAVASRQREQTTMAAIRAQYYQQFARDDVAPPVALSFGGWQSDDVELSAQHTALVVMHVWDCRAAHDRYPGWHRCNEQIDRMTSITQEVLGPL